MMLPLSQINLDILYSKILGGIKQVNLNFFIYFLTIKNNFLLNVLSKKKWQVGWHVQKNH